MNYERILSHQLSKKFTGKEIHAAAAFGTSQVSWQATYKPQGGWDTDSDVTWDM